MKRYLSYIIIIFLIPLNLAASEDAAPNMAMGFGGTYGRFDFYSQGMSKSESEFKPGYGYGGGLIFEKMFTSRSGIQSGLWYTQHLVSITELDKSTNKKVTNDFMTRNVSMPLYLVTSFNGASVSLNLLTGFYFTHLINSYVLSTAGNGNKKTDVSIYINENQVAVSAGLSIKFRIGKFTDIYIGGIADYYITKLMSDNAGDDNNIDHLYDFRGIAGVMFRTNIFPISGN